MSLKEIEIPHLEGPIPKDVRRFLKTARKRIESFMLYSEVHAFVPSDYELAYLTLKWIVGEGLVRGSRFCEWGSGFGVVACLADMLGLESFGIEIDSELVLRAQSLADEFGLHAQFVHGSFIPRQAQDHDGLNETFSWLTTEVDDAYTELDLELADMDLVYAYPWPDEELVSDQLFHDFGSSGSLFLAYSDRGFRLQRKVPRKRSGRNPDAR